VKRDPDPGVRPRLILTADDFGLHESINEAVESAHRAGAVSAASLMMGQPATADAVARARRLPALRVGLHLAISCAAPVLPAALLPDLVDASGRLPTRLVALGLRLATSAPLRAQVRAEMRAQFEAFAATGLALDHANVHQHLHMHPFVLRELLRIGRDHGLRAVRIPHEPLALARRVRASRGEARPLAAAAWFAGTAWMRARVRRAGLCGTDTIFGLRSSGRMDEASLLEALEELPAGVHEIYLHPAVRSGEAERAAGVGALAPRELAALLSPRVRMRLRELAPWMGGYADAFAERGA